MPTCDRRSCVSRAVELFLAQAYPRRELVVLDDGTDRVRPRSRPRSRFGIREAERIVKATLKELARYRGRR
jgi:hypothetical protein